MQPQPTGARTLTRAPWSTWRTITAFGLVSLCGDMAYEGMRSSAGPYLGSLGASAVTVGLVTGAGEALALGLRLVTGRLADRTGRLWSLTWGGYALTAVCVPLLALAPFVGAAGLVLASTLILAERTGKAVRSPSKSALLSHMARPVGLGRGFAVHKALDQVGAVAGPLVVAGLALLTGRLWPGFAVLAIPGAASMLLLAQLRRRAPIELGEPVEAPTVAGPTSLPRAFYLVAISCASGAVGLATFGVISLHLVSSGLVTLSLVPVVYAGAMLVEAGAALLTGPAYDRVGGRVLYVVPLLIATVPALVFGAHLWLVLAGIAAWGIGTGVQDSTVKALVADVVPRHRLATAYGVFAAFQGVGALVGGVLAGGLYQHHLTLLVVLVAGAQVVSLASLMARSGRAT